MDGASFLFNCYLPMENKETTEIDAIMIHHSGIYVFESKNYARGTLHFAKVAKYVLIQKAD